MHTIRMSVWSKATRCRSSLLLFSVFLKRFYVATVIVAAYVTTRL